MQVIPKGTPSIRLSLMPMDLGSNSDLSYKGRLLKSVFSNRLKGWTQSLGKGWKEGLDLIADSAVVFTAIEEKVEKGCIWLPWWLRR